MPLSLDGTGSITGIGTFNFSDEIIHVGDTNTKIRFPANDVISFETAGGERIRISSNGDVRVGGGSPATFGSGTTVHETYNSSTYVANLVTSGTHQLQMIASQTHGATSIGTRSNHDLNLCANDLTKMTIKSDGNVGIGTNNPTDILDINSDSGSAVTNMYLRNHANLGGAALNIWTQGTYASPTYKAIIGCSDAGGTIRMGAHSNHDLLLLTNNTPRVTITSDGKTGINNSIPQKQIHISTTGNQKIVIDPNYANNSGGSSNSEANANNIVESILIRTSFGDNAASQTNAGHKWGIKFQGYNGNDFTQARSKCAAVYAVSEDTAAGYNRNVGLAFHTSQFDTAHREVMRIDTNGRVTKPYQPSFHVTTSGGQINSNVGVINFNDTTSHINHNTGSHYNTSNGRFTAPIAGKYLITARMLTNSSTQSYTIYLIRRNGTSLGYIGHNHSDYWLMESGTFVMNLNANDYIDCYLQQHSGHGGYGYASFSGFLIG